MKPYAPDWMRRDLQKPLRSAGWLQPALRALIERAEETMEQDGLRAHIEFSEPPGEKSWTPQLKAEFSRHVLRELQQQIILALSQVDPSYGLVGVFASRQLEMNGCAVFASIEGGAKDTFTTVLRSKDQDQVLEGGAHTVQMDQVALFVRPLDQILKSWLSSAR